ncbi:hypothetical protein MBLNU230_g0839t1 [Neophaeotheca triangularis]
MSVRQVLAATVMAVAAVSAEDVLYSRRHLEKRFIDEDGNYNISFYHINDVHAHLDEFTSSGADCEDPEDGCYGGYARVKHVVDEMRPMHEDSLFLNAGDEFQGTLFYSYYGGEKIAETINQLGFDALTLGNHEFDGGDEELAEFVANLTFPVLACNIQTDNEILNSTIEAYHIYEEYDLAVIGAITQTTPQLASPGNGTIFLDVVESVQRAIDEIYSTTNITRIAALTHIGYEQDQALAENTTGLYLIMGGHSHTPLGNRSDDEGPYPTIRQNLDGEDVFIVTAYRWGEYLGYIDVTYDPAGKILSYHGGPLLLDNSTSQDGDLQAQIESWRGPFEAFAAEELGTSLVELDQTNCQRQECLLGNFMTDAMLAYRLNTSNTADFALINAGGIRATIDAGPVTRGEVLTAFPFGNAIVEIALSGRTILAALEGIVSGSSPRNGEEVTSFFQISRNIVVAYDPDAPAGSRLVRVTVAGDDMVPDRVYNMVTLDFIAGGGDNFFAELDGAVPLDLQDEVLVAYVQAQSPIDVEIEGRIVETEASGSPGGVVGGNGTVGGNATSTVGGDGNGNGTVGPLPSATAEVVPSEGAAAAVGRARSVGAAAVLALVALGAALVL